MNKKQMLALVLCVLLPLNAMAVTEGVVEDAPMVEIETSVQEEISYLPDASYYAGANDTPEWENAQTWVPNDFDGEYYSDVTQNPRLTAGEQKRAEKLLSEYQAGKIAYTGESVLEKMDGVIVGVYALDPADYDGETVYVILPGTCLTDEQLLSIIAAFDELGLVFDPTGLSYRNCSRGGGIETSRFFNQEERERYTYLADCIRRGKLVPPQGLSGASRTPKLQSAYFCGMTSFTLRPYRQMTDEEMVAQLLDNGVCDESGEVDHNAVERRSRSAAYTALGCPLSMELGHIYTSGSYVPQLYTADGQMTISFEQGRAAFGAFFTYSTGDGISVYVNTSFDKQSEELISVSMMHDRNLSTEEWWEQTYGASQEKIEASIAEVEEKLGFSGVEWHVMAEDEVFTNWGACIPVRAQVGEEWFFTIYIGCDDGKTHGLELTRGTLVEALPSDGEGQNE